MFFCLFLIYFWVLIEVLIGIIVNIKVYDVICKFIIYMKLKIVKIKVKFKDVDFLNKV